MINSESYAGDREKRSKTQQKAEILKQKSLLHFSQRETFFVFASLGGDENDSKLLQKYQDMIAASSPVARRELLKDTSAQHLTDLRKLHMALYLAKHPELNDEQKEVVCKVISTLKPDFFETNEAGNRKIEGLDTDLKNRILAAFSKQQASEIFVNFANQ